MEIRTSQLAEKSVIEFTNQQLLALMGPLLLEQLLGITVGFADSLMVSTVGEAAISAVSLVDSVSTLMIAIFSAMATGGAVVAGQYIGRQERENACNASQQLVMLLGLMSLLITALLYIFKTSVLTVIFGKIEPDVMEATNAYYSIVIASIPAIALYNGGAAIFRTMERSNVTLKVSFLMNVINVSGNALLIFGFGMDVAGVAIPTLVSRFVAAAVILGLLFNEKLPLHLTDIRTFRFIPKQIKNIIYIGVPSGIENGMFHFGRLILFSLVSTMGTNSIVANAIGNTLTSFRCFVGQAINLGLTTVISKCVGAGAFDKAIYYMRKLRRASFILMAAVNLTIIALLPLVMRIYDVSSEAEHLAVVISLIHGIAVIFFWNPGFMFPTFLRAAGDARYTMLMSMATMWLCRVLFAYILGKYMGFGVIGVWIAHAIMDWSVRSMIFLQRYHSGKWMSKAIKS